MGEALEIMNMFRLRNGQIRHEFTSEFTTRVSA